LASGLLAAYWLRISGQSNVSELYKQNWTVKALFSLGRPDVEGQAVIYTDDVRRLLGHASLEVTFERYIHTVDLIAANAIHLAEQRREPSRVSTHYAAILGCVDTLS